MSAARKEEFLENVRTKWYKILAKYNMTGGCGFYDWGFHIDAGNDSEDMRFWDYRGATSVHYGANDRDTEDGDMMVFDVGARSGFYSADISRSFPVNGKFTKEQKEIYGLVLKAQKAAIEEMKPGVNIGMASKAALDVLNEGLAELGLITDLESAWQKRFWIHPSNTQEFGIYLFHRLVF